MSTTIDERVVEMRFDNRHFEQNVSTTMSSLEKLKRSLNLSGASKGLENVGAAAKNCDMSPMTGAVQTLQTKFSALEIMAVTALANITNSAVNAGKRIVSALTIDPIKTGFSEYETQINAVQTILANTSSKGTTLDDVNNALDTLNEYADKTIYNFTEMTRNIGTFTAAGVDLDTSVKSIQGIANLAAVSGSTSQQASNAMYQLSQALAAGRVSLMDWNSVVNAGMGGQVFQDALKRTAKTMGIVVDESKSFRESISGGDSWLTSEVLTKTLEQFTMAAKEGTEQWEAYKKSLMEEGYTEAQALEILKMANTATDAATKVKTFTQLWDTLKEAAQSGWTQTWEIIVGDFEEAKYLLTNISNVLNGMIGASAQARNELLQGWKDAGGRTDLIEGFSNIFNGLMNVINPIKEAFRDIFPPITVEQLTNFTKGFKNLTENFKEFTEKYGDQIKSTFSGIFSVLDIGWTIIQSVVEGISKVFLSVLGFGGGLLNVSSSIGDFLTNLRESVKETDIFGKAIDKITDAIVSVIEDIKEFGSTVKENFKTPGYDGFVGFLKTVWDLVKMIGSGIGDMFSSIGSGISKALGDSSVGDVLNSGIFAGILVGVGTFVKKITDSLGSAGEILENVAGILDDVRGCFQAYQEQLKAGALMKIATAIGILTAAIFVLSTIDAVDLAKSLTAMTVMFGQLLGSLALFGKMSANIKGVTKAIALMTGMSIAITILSVALKNISTVSWEGIAKGLVAIGVLMAELSLFLRTAEFDGKITRAAIGIVILSSAMLILAKAVEDFGAMSWSEIGKGLAAIGALLVEIAVFTKLTGNAKNVISTATAMVLLGSAMKIFASAMKDFSSMSWEEIGKGLAAIGGALLTVGVVMRLMPKNMVGIGAGLVIVGAALKILTSVMSDLNQMEWSEIGKGLAAMGGALLILAVALKLMNGTLAGSAALIIAAGALAILTPILHSLGNMSWGKIAKGLVTMAGAFAVIGIAGLVLAPLVPAILGLSAALALLGIATIGIGAGLTLISAGLTALAVAGVSGATAIVAALTVIITGIADLIPTLAEKFAEAIAAFCVVIAESAPQIANSLLILLVEVLKALATYTPQIVDYLMVFLIDVLGAFANRLPELIVAAVDVIVAFFQGIGQALSGIDTTGLLQGIAGIGLLSALMLALSAVASLIPGAMIGVLGMGVVVAELALVLAAIGAFAQIPGLEWLISEGGDFLGTIGTAIGQFVGGIIGGIGQGITSSLPEMATNLSAFMTNLQPFIDGASGLDASMLEGVKSLAETILILTAADVLEGITSWLTGGSSIADFALELVPLGVGLQAFAKSVAGIDPNSVIESTKAIKALVDIAESLPNSGGLASLFAGDNDISDFASKLVPLGEGIKKYSVSVVGVDPSAVNASVTAAKQILNLIKSMAGLDTGGVKSFTSALTSLGKVSIDAFVLAFTSSYPRLTTLGSDMVNSIITGMQMRTPTVITNIVMLLTDMLSAINSKYELFKSNGAQLITRLIAGMNAQKNRAKVVMNAVLTATIKAIRSYYKTFYDAGAYLVSGFTSGIKDNVKAAAQAAAQMAAAAAQAAKKALNEHSPSRVGYEIGEFFGIGFVNGVNEYADKSYKAGSAMATAAKNGLNEAISKIKDFVNSDMDVVPTIRPVLDLSEVQNGANTLNGLFTNQSLALAGVNANLTNNRAMIEHMQKANDPGNAEIVNAITNLRGDFGTLVDAINGMHIRMDSGAVVGELIGKIDSGLGQIASHKGRGN